MHYISRFSILACLILSFTCGSAAAKDKTPVQILYVEWSCAVTTGNLAKAVIEEKLGRPCQLVPVTTAVIFQSLSHGEGDATLVASLPYVHRTYWEKVQDKVDDLGVIVNDARVGLVVPDYVSYTSIEQLKDNAAEFGGKIYGIDPGAGLMISAEKALKGYGLDEFELIEGSDAVMVAMLADAIKRKQPVVVTGWAPHWKFGRWDLHFLDDPKGLFGSSDAIHALGRKGLKDDMPDVHAFLQKFSYTDARQMQKLMLENEKNDADPLENAKKFIRENPDQVANWLK